MAWYNYDKINSYNACFNFILTNRGFGKSYGAKKQVIRNFIKKGEQFIYCRRWKTELSEFNKFFDDIRQEFPDHELTIKGKIAYVDGKVCGYAIPLSVSQKYKSTPYPFVTTIIYDEFIIDKSTGVMRYIPNEVDIFLDLFETVARTRDNVKAYFLANFISEVNPYFVYFNITPKKDERFTLAKNGELIIDVTTNNDFIESKKNTRFGKLISGTKYSDYAIDNKALRDSNTFIEKISLKNCLAVCSVTLGGQTVMIWNSYKLGLFYCNRKVDWTFPNFTLSIEDHSNNALMNGKILKFGMFNEMIRYFQLGKVRFADQQTKILMYDVFRKLGVK